jgi:hypothetical protein
MDKLMKDLLKEAHDHGFAIALSSICWDIEKSWAEFLKQNNIPLITEDEIRDQAARKAIQLKEQGHSLRNIASILGYNHPQSIKNIMMWYSKRQNKRNQKEDNR